MATFRLHFSRSDLDSLRVRQVRGLLYVKSMDVQDERSTDLGCTAESSSSVRRSSQSVSRWHAVDDGLIGTEIPLHAMRGERSCAGIPFADMRAPTRVREWVPSSSGDVVRLPARVFYNIGMRYWRESSHLRQTQWASYPSEEYSNAVSAEYITASYVLFRRSCERLLESDPDSVCAWFYLAIIGGGIVGGIHYTKGQCYEGVLRNDAVCAPALFNLGVLGGGVLAGEFWGASACIARALQLDPTMHASVDSQADETMHSADGDGWFKVLRSECDSLSEWDVSEVDERLRHALSMGAIG